MKYTSKHQIMQITIEDQVAVLTMQMPGKVNKINHLFVDDFTDALNEIKKQTDLRGVIITSTHQDFCVGADLDVVACSKNQADLEPLLHNLNQQLRNLEQLKVPVIAAINGSAFGGGYELALACHRRVAVQGKQVRIGLPEVMLGLIPGAGGTQRLPRLIGIQKSLEAILQGKIYRTQKAFELGMVDALAKDSSELMSLSKEWIQKYPTIQQPWDQKKSKGLYSGAQSEEDRNIFLGTCAFLQKKTAGAVLAPKLALSAIQEGLKLTFDGGIQVENQYFMQAVASNQSSAMIDTFWVHKSKAEKLAGLPEAKDHGIKKIGIIGAGMMGKGLANLCAKSGFQVVLKDIDENVLENAMQHCVQHSSPEVAKRITLTTQSSMLHDCELIIEAVFENLKLKHQVMAEIESKLEPHIIWASNTSALPISDIAKGAKHPERVIGMHFFSPVEKMQLLELIMGTATQENILARSLAYTKSIRKLPIVVRDGYGFYTSRLFSAYIMQGIQLVAEGHDPVLVEWAAKQAGMVVAPLQVTDEVSLSLIGHAIKESETYLGKNDTLGYQLLTKLVTEHKRTGKKEQQGFYDYSPQRKIWKNLYEIIPARPQKTGVPFLERRLMLAQCAEVARAMDDKILYHNRDAELGAIFGTGFAPQTGGPLHYIDRLGIGRTIDELEKLCEDHGKQFKPAQILYQLKENNEKFFQ